MVLLNLHFEQLLKARYVALLAQLPLKPLPHKLMKKATNKVINKAINNVINMEINKAM